MYTLSDVSLSGIMETSALIVFSQRPVQKDSNLFLNRKVNKCASSFSVCLGLSLQSFHFSSPFLLSITLVCTDTQQRPWPYMQCLKCCTLTKSSESSCLLELQESCTNSLRTAAFYIHVLSRCYLLHVYRQTIKNQHRWKAQPKSKTNNILTFYNAHNVISFKRSSFDGLSQGLKPKNNLFFFFRLCHISLTVTLFNYSKPIAF